VLALVLSKRADVNDLEFRVVDVLLNHLVGLLRIAGHFPYIYQLLSGKLNRLY
jgi:hypothetical protein